jgi:Galactose binding lectin domain
MNSQAIRASCVAAARIVFVLMVVAIVVACLPPLARAQVQLVPYGTPGFRYEIVAGSFPPGVEQPGYDDSGLSVGAAPFSSGGGCGGPLYAAATAWPIGTELVARLHFNLSRTFVGASLRFGIDNDVTIYINGQQVASESHLGCAAQDDYVVSIPDGVLVPGSNLFVALAKDNGGLSAFDVSLFAAGNADHDTLCAQVDEGSTVKLTAAPGKTITSIDFASYGSPTGTCGNFVAGDCNATTSRSVVEAACLGQNSCSVLADNSVFGDPCVGTSKRLYVQAEYGNVPTPAHRSTWGQLKTRYH